MAAEANQLLNRIPDENEVRDRLAQNLREAAMLRSLLRVAQKKTKLTSDRSIELSRSTQNG